MLIDIFPTPDHVDAYLFVKAAPKGVSEGDISAGGSFAKALTHLEDIGLVEKISSCAGEGKFKIKNNLLTASLERINGIGAAMRTDLGIKILDFLLENIRFSCECEDIAKFLDIRSEDAQPVLDALEGTKIVRKLHDGAYALAHGPGRALVEAILAYNDLQNSP